MDSTVSIASSLVEPQDDMEFESHEAAYSFYKEYAKSVGFGTAKLSSRRSRASKEFIDAKFSCIRYGNKQQSDDAINPRPSPKIGCKASMHVKRRSDGKWYIYSFVKDHNHELLPAQVHFFRSHRDVDTLKTDARTRKRKIQAAGSGQFSAYQNIDFLEGFMKNHHGKGRTLALQPGDAQVMLELFMYMQEKNPKFFYAVDLNEEHRLRNVFWVDAKGMDDYANFCDVVLFDITYVTDKYKIPLVLFTGVNHHIQPTLLGFALIADETVYTFVWLMQTWLISMGGRAPRVILTDQSNAIKAAVGAVFPDTRHCFCLWHILERIPRKLDYLSLWLDSFMEKFRKCIYMSWTEEQFEKRWWKLLERFNLRADEWVQSLYEDRMHWVPIFMRDVSLAGLSSSSRAESLNSSFDKYIHRETSLREFIEQYKLILEDRYEKEAEADFDAWHETPELKSPSPFEKQMSLVYTHEVFKKFQVQVLGAAACHLKKENEHESVVTYSVKDFEDNEVFLVEWDESKSDIYCSCHSFEYKGYFCRHTIVVLQMSGVFSIPFKYILQRWTNAALSRHPISEHLDEVQSKVRRLNDLCRRAIILGEEGSLSEDSYNIALCKIREALKQCVTVNNTFVENDARSNTSTSHVCGMDEDNYDGDATKKNNLPDPSMTDPDPSMTDKVPQKALNSKDKSSNENNASSKRTVPLEPKAASLFQQDGINQMELPNMMPPQLQPVVPTQLHNPAPTVFHHLHNMPSTRLPDGPLQR